MNILCAAVQRSRGLKEEVYAKSAEAAVGIGDLSGWDTQLDGTVGGMSTEVVKRNGAMPLQLEVKLKVARGSGAVRRS